MNENLIRLSRMIEHFVYLVIIKVKKKLTKSASLISIYYLENQKTNLVKSTL